MDANPAETTSEGQPAPQQQLQQLQQQLEALRQNLRAMRHAINNDVAVIMALAELSQRNPTQTTKLIQVCLEKGPQISGAVARFYDAFNGTLNFPPSAKPTS
ncbi:MAG: hypothetical protein N3B01_07330 [Verrucomicrobiae bacterium]|nr:hypothetical protein [Verrucomicrobiae bacterium]